MDEDVNETELCMRFVDLVLTGLFDDADNRVLLQVNKQKYYEVKQHNSCIDCRPDLCITKSCGVKWGADCGYGEAKPAARDNNRYLVCVDLIRVAILSKEALRKQCLDGVLGIQIIGRILMFYVLLLPAEGVYMLLQLAEIKIPDSLQTLAHLLINIPGIFSVMDIFDRLCVRSNDPQIVINRKMLLYLALIRTSLYHSRIDKGLHNSITYIVIFINQSLLLHHIHTISLLPLTLRLFKLHLTIIIGYLFYYKMYT